MDNNEQPKKNAKHIRLAQRLADLQRWVELELSLPEDDQVTLGRIDAAVRSFLGEFTQRATRRAKRDMARTVMTLISSTNNARTAATA